MAAAVAADPPINNTRFVVFINFICRRCSKIQRNDTLEATNSDQGQQNTWSSIRSGIYVVNCHPGIPHSRDIVKLGTNNMVLGPWSIFLPLLEGSKHANVELYLNYFFRNHLESF